MVINISEQDKVVTKFNFTAYTILLLDFFYGGDFKNEIDYICILAVCDKLFGREGWYETKGYFIEE